jgi:hypothetical protein
MHSQLAVVALSCFLSITRSLSPSLYFPLHTLNANYPSQAQACRARRLDRYYVTYDPRGR